MDIEEIYTFFDKIGCITFATIDNGLPQARIAHLFACDHEGLYFRTMIIKPFYAQLKKTGTVAVCGIYPYTAVSHDDQGMPTFEPGYAVRATGYVREISLEKLKQKAKEKQQFDMGVKDIEKYPAMTTFCLYKGWGEVFDFDFEMQKRDHKLLRKPFAFGGQQIPFRGVRITGDCIGCGLCLERCSFKAISRQGEGCVIDQNKCDVCGDCYIVCPADAVEIVNEPPEH